MANEFITVGSNLNEKVKTLKYLSSFLTNKIFFLEEIKYRLKTGNSCYYSVETGRLLSKNLKVKIYIAIMLPVVLYGCEAWSLTLTEERRLRVFVNIFEYLALSGIKSGVERAPQ